MKKNSYSLHFVRVGTPEESAAVVKKLVKTAIQKVLDKHGAESPNLDEVLQKYIRVEK